MTPTRRRQLDAFKQRTKARKAVYRQVVALGLPDQDGWKAAFHRIQHRDAAVVFGHKAARQHS